MRKTTFYTVIENQLRLDGSRGLFCDHFEDYNETLAKYYSVCSEAAISELPYHSVHIIRDDGIMIESRVFDRRNSFAIIDD